MTNNEYNSYTSLNLFVNTLTVKLRDLDEFSF